VRKKVGWSLLAVVATIFALSRDPDLIFALPMAAIGVMIVWELRSPFF
jgi:hypothetical protein